MSILLHADASGRLIAIFHVSPDSDEEPDGKAIVAHLRERYAAVFGQSQDDVLGDDVWVALSISGLPFEYGWSYGFGLHITSLEPAGDPLLLEIAADFVRNPPSMKRRSG